jgi:predicted Zn-dependent protease
MWLTLAVFGLLAAPAFPAPSDSERYPSEEAVRRYTTGRVMEERGFRSDAMNEYFRAFALDPDPGIAIRVSEVSAGRGDHEQSLEFADKALALDPRNARALWLRGSALFNLDRNQEALRALRAAAEADSEEAEYQRTLGRLADRLDDLPLAARCYRRAVWIDDTDGETWFQLAATELRLGRFGAADTALTYAADLNPIRPGLMFMQGFIAQSLGRNGEAIDAYREHLAVHPDDLAGRRQLLLVLARDKRWQEALVEARALSAAQPDDLELMRWHADMAFEAGKESEARKVLAKLSAKQPGDLEALSMRVSVLARHGKAKDAAKEVEKELAKHPDDFDLLLLAARTQLVAEQPALALPHVERARTVAPDSLAPRVLLARVYSAQKREHDAERELAEASRRFPHANGVFFELAAVREKLGDVPGAEAAVRDVLNREPDNIAALNALGYLWADHDRNLEEAVRMIQKALESDPENGAFLDSLGWAYYRLGRLQDARELLERALVRSGGDAVIHEHLGDVYKALRLNGLARDQYRLTLATDKSNPRVRAKLDGLR